VDYVDLFKRHYWVTEWHFIECQLEFCLTGRRIFLTGSEFCSVKDHFVNLKSLGDPSYATA